MVILVMVLVVMGLILLQSTLYRRFWREGLLLNVRFASKEAFEGDSMYLLQELSNKKILPLPWILMRYQVSKHLVFDDAVDTSAEFRSQNALFSVMMYQSVRRRLRFVCGKRGFYRLRNVNVTCNNLLHTKRFVDSYQCNSELTVFPRILQDLDELDMVYKSLDAAMLSNSLINPDPFEFKGIREYSPTDPLRNVNFKASAVAQQLMVNIYAPTAAKRLEIVLNVDHYTKYPNYELYEQGIRMAATVASRYINEDVRVSFFTNGADVYMGNQIKISGGNSSAHLHSILEGLARVDVFFRAAPLVPQLYELTDSDVVYLIISSYHGKDFVQALEDMQARGLDYIAVVPVEKGDKIDVIETDRIKTWEAL